MIRIVHRLLRRSGYQPLNRVMVFKQALRDNYKYLSNINSEITIAPVLKSNGYGHGIGQVGKLLDEVKAPFFCVDSLYEAYLLLKAKVKTPILIMGYIDPKSLMVKRLPFSYAIFDLKVAEVLNKYQKGAKVHIFVDTGMNREGVKVSDLDAFVSEVKKYKNIEVVGVMSHLACAEAPEHEVTKLQLDNFILAREICEKNNLALQWKHLGGSGAILNLKNPPCNLLRVGKALYGIGPSVSYTALTPALKMTTKIEQIKKISKGSSVGYDATFTAKKDMLVGVLPIGYYDGVDRRLSNKGVVLVDGVECPIIGLISMNITTIDLTSVKDPQVGQEVVVFSDKPQDPNSILKSSQIADTIPYDILVHLASSTRRTFY